MAELYQRNGIWHVDYSYCGQRVRRSLRTRNERVAQAELKKIDYELSAGLHHLPKQTPITEFLTSFLAHMEGRTSLRHYRSRRSLLRAAFGPIVAELAVQKTRRSRKGNGKTNGTNIIKVRHLEDITVATIGRYLDDQARIRGWNPTTYNRARETFHLMYEYAIRMYDYASPDLRYRNPIKAIPTRRRPAADIRFLRLPEIEKQLSALEHVPLLHAVVATLIYAGLRRGEVVWLTKEDVDLDERVLRIRPKSGENDYWEPKTKTNRVVPISSDLLSVLTNYGPPKESRWFFPAPAKSTSRWDEDNLSRTLHRVNKKNGLSWTCLDFRHTFGSQLAKNNVSLYKIATLMGNSPEICRRHYAALIPEELADCVEFGHVAAK